MIAALVGALLLLVGAYWRTIAGASVGRHRLSRTHPGWESAPEDLATLQRLRRAQ